MMRKAQSLKLKAESLQLDIQGMNRGRSLLGFLHSAFCFKLFTFSFLLFAFCFSCSSASKEDSNADTWEVTRQRKSWFPSARSNYSFRKSRMARLDGQIR